MEKYNYNGVEYQSEIDLNKQLIIDSIRESFSEHPEYHQTQILTTSVYRIIYSIFIDKKKIIFLDAPTGTGKSIIGYMIHYCYHWIMQKRHELDLELSKPDITTYTLTSSKILQEQLENDFINFKMEDHFTMLKGMANYECKEGTKKSNTYIPYTDRICKGVKIDQLDSTWECFNTCEYMQRRLKASRSPSAVINYAYFLTIMNAKFSPYFGPRDLVIADEGHLVPQIVTGMFSVDLTLFKINKIAKVYSGIEFNFGKKLSSDLIPIKNEIKRSYLFFRNSQHKIENIIQYLMDFNSICESIINLMTIVEKKFPDIFPAFHEMWKKEFADIEDKYMRMDFDKNIEYLMSLKNRPEDIFIEAQSIGYNMYLIGEDSLPNQEYFKYIIRDLSEAQVTQKYFLANTKICIFMSATIGNIDEFGTLLGLNKDEYTGFSLPSTFDFSKSPIYLTNSGYLNYNNFQANIGKVLDDTIKILRDVHPNYGGIVHTSTFQITEMLKEKLFRQDKEHFNRYLFYENSAEKDKHIETIRKFKGQKPYVIIGPSLYEGIDLKNELGRLNIIVKAPYAALDNYTKQKIKRYPFYYERETLEKLQQAIGRTNRNKDDWSITYMMDSMLNNLVWKLPNYITSRVKNKKLY